MTKLFSRTFSSTPEDVKIDLETSQKIHLLQTFLKPEHLDIPAVLRNEASWLVCLLHLLCWGVQIIFGTVLVVSLYLFPFNYTNTMLSTLPLILDLMLLVSWLCYH